jgi:tetrahydrodipicolinate N-succinyltransferase
MAADQGLIDRAWDERDAIGPDTKGEVRQAVDAAIAALDSGEARIAEPTGDGWTVHQWPLPGPPEISSIGLSRNDSSTAFFSH